MASIEKIAESVETIKTEFEKHQYICSDQIATAVYLAYHLRKPILIEGPPGVGKTELAKTASEMFDLSLIRLQCYEGLDESKAIYEWKYGKQLLYTQVLKDALDEVLQGAKGFRESVNKLHDFGDIFFSEEFLEPRPLLKALREEEGCVLLIDEVDKSRHIILSDIPDSLPQGRSSFLIETSPYMKQDTELQIDFIDSEGASIYTEPIADYLEGMARRVSVEVYDDTAPGIASLLYTSPSPRDQRVYSMALG